MILVDNGKEFHSHALRHACAMLGITITYAPAGAPERKPHIERLVGTINRAIAHRMPGTTFSNARAKGDYNSKEEAVHDIGFLRNRVAEWIARIYHRRPHRGIGEPPIERWKRGVERHPPVLPPSVRDLRVLLCKTVEGCTLSRHGIQLENLRYNSGELADILVEAGEDQLATDIRMDPDDVGAIYVLHPRRRTFVEVPSLDPDYTRGLSLYVHREIWKAKRKAIEEGARNTELVAAQAEFRRSLQGPNKPRRKTEPGGAREARKLGAKLDATLRDAIVSGGGSAPGWVVEAGVPCVETITGDRWPVAVVPAALSESAVAEDREAVASTAEIDKPARQRDHRAALPMAATATEDEEWSIETFIGPDRS